MDMLTLGGIALALAAIVGGNILEGGHTESLVQLTAFLIVFGGTLGAIMVQVPLQVFMHGLRMAKWVVVPPRLDGEAQLAQITEWSNTARKQGLLGLEPLIESESDPFVQKGLQLLVDGSEPEMIRNILELDVTALEQRDLRGAQVYEGMGGYSPTIGIIGAVLGLIHVMNNLSDPDKLGPGIAVAFVATIYGVGFANIFFLPMAQKLKLLVQSQSQHREMVIEGLVAISEGENPRNIETKLQAYLT